MPHKSSTPQCTARSMTTEYPKYGCRLEPNAHRKSYILETNFTGLLCSLHNLCEFIAHYARKRRYDHDASDPARRPVRAPFHEGPNRLRDHCRARAFTRVVGRLLDRAAHRSADPADRAGL